MAEGWKPSVFSEFVAFFSIPLFFKGMRLTFCKESEKKNGAGKSMVTWCWSSHSLFSEDDMMYFYVLFLDKMKWTGAAFMLILVVWYASPTSWHIPKDLRRPMMWEINHVRPRQWCSSVGILYLRSIDVFCFLFGCRKHINQLRVWGDFAVENELSPGNLRNDRLVPFVVKHHP